MREKAGNIPVEIGPEDMRDLARHFGQATSRREGYGAYDIEILYLARLRGLAIAEVPVLWFNSPDSRVSVVHDALPTLWDLLRLRWLHRLN